MPKIDKNVLASFYNCSKMHRHGIRTRELTFLNEDNFPVYAKLTIEVIPDKKAVELKSVKIYLHQYRELFFTYPEILESIYNHFWDVYQPLYLKVKIQTSIRGGISSQLEKSSN